MFGTELAFDSPWWLLALPLLWIAVPVVSYGSLSGIGWGRWLTAVLLRCTIVTLLVLALAEAQYLRTSERMTVIYLLDQSESIPAEQRRAMLDYVIKEVSAHRDANREDKAGLIVFGRDAAIEVPPFEDDIQLAGKLETVLDLRKDATNLAAAMKLAQATLPEDSAKRIVIVTDGNENIGDARAIARTLVEGGVGIDVAPVEVSARAEVAVEKVTLPPDVRKGQPLVATMVLNNMTEPSRDNPTGEVRGTLRLLRRAGGEEETLEQSEVTLRPGKNVFQSRTHEIQRSQFYTYEARFDPADPRQDTMRQNNRAESFTHVRGKGHVLLIEDPNHRGEFQELIDLLQRKNIEVSARDSTSAFTSLADLQAYDCVILGNVPRSSPDELQGVVRVNKFFSDDQIDMLVRNTQQMGAGIVMLGGERSFGAGDWADTELEKAMPVDFTIRNAKIRGVGALVMLMHACELPQGNHWEKVVAKQAVQGLGSMDYCGLLEWNDRKGSDDWLWTDNAGNGLVQVGGQQQAMINRIGRMTPGDMPDFDSAMKRALTSLNQCTQATTKHMIIISDGDPSAPSRSVMQGFINAPPFVNGKAKGIQISTVAIGTHGPPGSTPLQNIATQTGGKYYVVTNAQALPRIYQREIRRVARPLIYEKPVVPEIVYRH
ncbi:MAG: VWA domain-containing protein, partial [Planctomycetales bacterium]|nr:VWA domain-containing protein [Planctomycetales bacterium]